jgi:polar amino acid transport system permease protein
MKASGQHAERHPSGQTTDLAVMLPVRRPAAAWNEGAGPLRLRARHGLWIAGVLIVSATVASAQSAPAPASIWSVLLKWSPLLLGGFAFNILISVMAMAIGTISGAALGLGQISQSAAIRWFSYYVTQFFRNSPWLVLLFFCMLLLPFQVEIAGVVIPLPDWMKATFGLALPVMANVSEIVRGAVNSLPSGQWEAAESLAFTRRQTLWRIILPQCVKRMMPPWMNLYSILTMATVLASIVGVSEVMTLAGEVLAAEGGRTDLLIPVYSMILLWFFVYCYPIARWTVRLEQKFAVKG